MSFGFYLYGSIQRGLAKAHSDIDVLYIGDEESYPQAVVQLEQYIQTNMPEHSLRTLDIKKAPIGKKPASNAIVHFILQEIKTTQRSPILGEDLILQTVDIDLELMQKSHWAILYFWYKNVLSRGVNAIISDLQKYYSLKSFYNCVMPFYDYEEFLVSKRLNVLYPEDFKSEQFQKFKALVCDQLEFRFDRDMALQNQVIQSVHEQFNYCLRVWEKAFWAMKPVEPRQP